MEYAQRLIIRVSPSTSLPDKEFSRAAAELRADISYNYTICVQSLQLTAVTLEAGVLLELSFGEQWPDTDRWPGGGHREWADGGPGPHATAARAAT
jgi:hypothetical protein